MTTSPNTGCFNCDHSNKDYGKHCKGCYSTSYPYNRNWKAKTFKDAIKATFCGKG